MSCEIMEESMKEKVPDIKDIENKIKKLEEMIVKVDSKQATNSMKIENRVNVLEGRLRNYLNDVDSSHRV